MMKIIKKLLDKYHMNPNNTKKILIIAPNAGFGNRLRTMASAIYLAEKLNMNIEHLWLGTPSGIIPYELNKKGYWKEKWGGDGMFYEDLAKLTEPVFLDIELYKINKNVNIRKPN